MIVKFFNHGSSPRGCLEYMLNEDRAEQPIILSGSSELTQELINRTSHKFSKCYTAGVLSFEESDINPKDKLAIMSDFEDALMAGIDRDDYNILWVEHRDKGRLELNFIIPRIHLSTEMHLQPFYTPADMKRIDAFKDCINLEYGLSNPKDLSKKQSFVVPRELPKNRKEIIHSINNYMADMIEKGEISNRKDVIEHLSSFEGIEIARATAQSISIKVEGHDRNIRLKGGVYEQEFTADAKRANQELGGGEGSIQQSNEEQLRSSRKLFKSLYERKRQDNEAKYRKYKAGLRKRVAGVHKEHHPKPKNKNVDVIHRDVSSEYSKPSGNDLLSENTRDKRHQSEYYRNLQIAEKELQSECGELQNAPSQLGRITARGIENDRESIDQAGHQRLGAGTSRFAGTLRSTKRYNQEAKRDHANARSTFESFRRIYEGARRVVNTVSKSIKQRLERKRRQQQSQYRGRSM